MPENALRPREQLGRELRSRRLLAGLSGPQLAAAIGTTQSKVSRTETARFRPNIELIRRWLEATSTPPGQRKAILALAEDAATEITEYRTLFRGSMVNAQLTLIEADALAKRIRHFQPLQIPGPMHTPRYARVAMMAGRWQNEPGLEEAINARMERGKKLIQPEAPPYEVIVSEPALRQRPWGITDSDQVEVWRKVMTFARCPSVTLRIIPAAAQYRLQPTCAFLITEFRNPKTPAVVRVELPPVEMSFSGSADIETFERVWDAMADAALSPADSTRFLRVMLRSVHSSE